MHAPIYYVYFFLLPLNPIMLEQKNIVNETCYNPLNFYSM